MNKREKIIVTSGEYDPLSVEELRFLRQCYMKGDWMIVGIHSDEFMDVCRGGSHQSFLERKEIISNIRFVDEVFAFDDSNGTVCNLLQLVKFCYPSSEITYVSQEDMHNMPETKIRGITFEVLKQGDF